MRHVEAFVLPRHAGIISPPSAMLHPEGIVVRSGLDIRERKQGGIGTKPMYVVRTAEVSASHSLCRAPNSGCQSFVP